MLSYTHFTLDERKYLQELLEQGHSIRKIASALGRSPSSISREIKRNRSKSRYHHWRAQILTECRRKNCERRRLKPKTPEWDYIVTHLKQFWSPEEICERWNQEHPDAPRIHFSTLYRYIKRKELPNISAKEHLRRRGKRMLPRNSSYNSIQPDRIIPEWPEAIRLRIRIGDWEGDTVYGGVGKGLLVTMVDRRSRYLRAALLENRNAAKTCDTIVAMMQGLPLQSISLDNGSEFADFRRLEEQLQTPVYFAEPHKPWQRGTNENTNDILRFFFPKGYDFRTLSQAELDKVVDSINARPRKCLGWKSPAEVFESESVALA
jgi:IS30 family transposase